MVVTCQIEIYFSVLQWKVLNPNYFESPNDLGNRILGFQDEYKKMAKFFKWKFTRKDLQKILAQYDDVLKMAA